MDNFFRNNVNYGLHIMSVTNNENIKNPVTTRVFLQLRDSSKNRSDKT